MIEYVMRYLGKEGIETTDLLLVGSLLNDLASSAGLRHQAPAHSVQECQLMSSREEWTLVSRDTVPGRAGDVTL